MGSRRGKIRHLDSARRLGVPALLVRAVVKRRGLPGALQHSCHWTMIPPHLLRLAEAYGLRRVEMMAKAGLIRASE